MMPTATNNNETTTLSPSATATWPPQSLAQHAQSIANHAEDLEVAGVDHNPLPHMASLLYLQDYQAAHYLYLRQPTEGQQQMLQPWYAVAVAALQNDVAGVWSTLAALTRAAALPPPAATYAREIAHAFRVACLSQWKEADEMIPPSYYVSVLGFASRDELVAFWHQHVVVAVADGKVRRRAFSATSSSASNNNNNTAQRQQQQQIVAFLESRLTVESSSSSSASAKPPAAL